MADNVDRLLLAVLPHQIHEASLLDHLLPYSLLTWTAHFLLSFRRHSHLVTLEVQSRTFPAQKPPVSVQSRMVFADLVKEVSAMQRQGQSQEVHHRKSRVCRI